MAEHVRDVFLAGTPRVLEADVYATVAMVGFTLMILLSRLRLAPSLAAMVGGVVCMVLRVVSVWEHWNLRKIRN